MILHRPCLRNVYVSYVCYMYFVSCVCFVKKGKNYEIKKKKKKKKKKHRTSKFELYVLIDDTTMFNLSKSYQITLF